ncbi:uncharacterized protein DS421_16g557150 [Arachis hypogaea]|nr:uncharacterized protein DS421_16g557150 [Arachis hypogaea]
MSDGKDKEMEVGVRENGIDRFHVITLTCQPGSINATHKFYEKNELSHNN